MKEKIRNFCIIAHIDHGKSTLADRFLEITNTLSPNHPEQYLDKMPLEREKGITIKMQPVKMEYKGFTLNLIDTPGHIDFSYEVSRSLKAVEGAILLVDATQGVQAQTLHNLKLAQEQNLKIIPAINKIDLKEAKIEEVEKEIKSLLGEEIKVSKISAKRGQGVEELLERVIKEIPPPKILDGTFKALIFDSYLDNYLGVVAYVRVFSGKVNKDSQIYLLNKKISCKIKNLGYFAPELKSAKELKEGEIGYIATGIKDPSLVRIGETITLLKEIKENKVSPIEGYKEPKPLVFISLYPGYGENLEKLKKALLNLNLEDPSFSFEPENRLGVGQGFKLGFLGTLHAEIIIERLKREFNLKLVISKPQVALRLIKNSDLSEKIITSPLDFPENPKNYYVLERWILLEIISPNSQLGNIFELLEKTEGKYEETKTLTPEITTIKYEMPLREFISSNFYDKLKSATHGLASLNYELSQWKEGKLVKMEILVAGHKEELLTTIVSKEKAYQEGKKIVKKLKEILPRELFPVALQAKVGGKIIARETIPALRKDVTGHLYGGDVTRKMKLLDKQKEGKKKLKRKGRVRIETETFLKLIREA